MKYIITGKGYISDLFTKADSTANILTEDEFKNSNLIIKSGDKVYATSESALESILEKSTSRIFSNAVNILKDKVSFRNLMSNLYPEQSISRLVNCVRNIRNWTSPKNTMSTAWWVQEVQRLHSS